MLKKWMKSTNRAVRIVLCLSVIGVAHIAPAQQQTRAQVVRGELNYIICSVEGGVRVRDESLNAVLFESTAFEHVRPFQGWGDNKKYLNIGGQRTAFVRVQFDNTRRSTNVGWIAEQFLKLRSQCPQANQAQAATGSGTQITGLDDSKCCLFPINHHPLLSYTTGERMFGSGRSKGRLHGASDLYGTKNEPIRAVAAGQVVRGLYDFYYRTFALDVKHQGGFVVRYGEMSGRRTDVSDTGSRMRMGETVGHMGQLVPAIRPPMLHFELYRGNRSGFFLSVDTSRTNRYGRRADLMDPTQYLQNWERKTF